MLLLIAIAISGALLAALNLPHSYENFLLITILNFIFITLISALLSIVAARSFLTTGSWYLLGIGAAWLILGIVIPEGALLLTLGDNAALTVHNGGVLAAAICQVVSAVLAYDATTLARRRSGRLRAVLAVYGATLVLIALLTLATVNQLLPAFVISGQGFTELRQRVLGTGTGLFVIATAVYAAIYVRTKSDFIFWYCLSLGAVATGLAAVFVQPSVGSIVGWVGRGAQQLGGIYLLAAVAVALAEARARRVGIEEALAGVFRHPLAGYQLVFEAAFSAIVSTDQEGQVLMWNPAAERMFGYRSKKVVGVRLSDLIVPAGQYDFVSEELAGLLMQRQEVLVGEAREVEVTRRSGEVFPALFSFSARRAASGWFTSILISDISKEKQIERALKESEARFAAFMNNSPAIAWMKDEHGRHVFLNKAYEDRFGVSLQDARGKTDFQLWPSEIAEQFRKNDLAVLASGQSTEVIEEARTPDGLRSYWWNYKFPFEDASGRRYVGAVGMDITERMAAEQERERLLAAEQQARAEAELALAVQDEFLSIAAHELKTPITSLLGFAQTLLRYYEKHGAVEPSRLNQALHSIDRQAHKLSTLVSQLLDVSHLESGQLVLERQHVDLVSLVEELVAVILPSITRHTLAVVAPDHLEVSVDPLRFEQVIANLVDNAIRYSPEGGPVEVGVSKVGTKAEIRVRDWGIGIPPEHRPHVFDRLYRAHPGGHIAGLGLGLYISNQIVALHGGRIEAQFPPDGGTCFVVTLPSGEAELDESAPREEH